MKVADIPHRDTVSCVAYLGAPYNAVITASWDKLLRLYDDTETESDCVRLRKEARPSTNEITCSTVSSNLTLVASGSLTGTIVLWDYDANTIECELEGHQSEITALNFMVSK